jgi:hypothetical protein
MSTQGLRLVIAAAFLATLLVVAIGTLATVDHIGELLEAASPEPAQTQPPVGPAGSYGFDADRDLAKR